MYVRNGVVRRAYTPCILYSTLSALLLQALQKGANLIISGFVIGMASLSVMVLSPILGVCVSSLALSCLMIMCLIFRCCAKVASFPGLPRFFLFFGFR